MKTFYFNIQAKGGTGKSMLTYLQALKNEDNEKAAFVELDSSTQTTLRQLKFIALKDRLFEIDIFDKFRKIERERLFESIEGLNASQFSHIYLDFGAPESDQLASLIRLDFSIDDLKSFEVELDAKFIFNVIIAGGTSYASTVEYLQKISEAVKGYFDVVAYVNEYTFQHYDKQLEDFLAFAKGEAKDHITKVIPFGDIHPDRSSGQMITNLAGKGKGLDNYTSFAAKTIIKREIAKI